MKEWLQSAPRFLFFTGKGGVGKTSLSCATAVALADAGRQVLLISTDPASNLDEVLQTTLSTRPLVIEGVSGLRALNIDPVAAALEYRERIVGPYRGLLPDAAVRSIEEQLSGACTVEIASFNEFTRMIADEKAVDGFEHIILDTAPTGHTLRLLSLPAAWNDFIADNKTGSSCLGPLAGLKEQRHNYEKTVSTLQDGSKTLLVLVARAETSALQEAERASTELMGLGLKNQRLIINGIFKATKADDAVACAFEKRGRLALERLPSGLARIPRTDIPYQPGGIVGVKALRVISDTVTVAEKVTTLPDLSHYALTPMKILVDELAESGKGIILTMGKGGVGKTTVAGDIAVQLAEMGHRVLLSTTDPAGHWSPDLSGVHPNLQVSRINPVRETREHVERTLAAAAGKMDAAGLALLKEELQSPCTEEVAVFTAFARIVAEGKEQFVVLDTAPTGHTLLLLDATESYHREVLRSASNIPESVRELLPRLRDPKFTRVFLVTLAEATPVHEAEQLQRDLERAKIHPYAWVINQSVGGTDTQDPVLLAKAMSESVFIAEVTGVKSRRTALIPWCAGNPWKPRQIKNLYREKTV